MKSADYWITHLQLLAHPEGGFYKETYRAGETIPELGLPDRFSGARSLSTSIYFLLRSQDRSLFHRIKSDELWHYHAGDSLSIYVLSQDGLRVHTVGPAVDKGELLQVVVPANCWFGALVNQKNSYTLAGCTVAPGFDFEDFELAKRDVLIREYPGHGEIINRLTI